MYLNCRIYTLFVNEFTEEIQNKIDRQLNKLHMNFPKFLGDFEGESLKK